MTSTRYKPSLKDVNSTYADRSSQRKIDYRQIVSIEVGSEKETFRVHKDLLVSKSEFFRAALKDSWIESQNGSVTLADTKVPEFEIFVHWLYYNAIESQRPQEEWDVQTWESMVSLWCTGDALMSIHFKNAVMNLMVKKRSDSQGPSTFNRPLATHIYDVTVPGSKLRLFFADSWARCTNLEPTVNHERFLTRNDEYLKDIALVAIGCWVRGEQYSRSHVTPAEPEDFHEKAEAKGVDHKQAEEKPK